MTVLVLYVNEVAKKRLFRVKFKDARLRGGKGRSTLNGI
jgi:hypothetical protein